MQLDPMAWFHCFSVLLFIATVTAENWMTLKKYDLSNMQQIRQDWNIMKWLPGTVNKELQEYTDHSENVYTENGMLVLRAIKRGTKCHIESNKDIEENNLYPVHGRPSSACCDLCNAASGCKAYSWNSYKNGTCWLKSRSGPLVDNNGVSVGVLYDNKQCYMESNKDIQGNDVQAISGRTAVACCNECRNVQGCKGYSWNDYQGGTCWLKNGTSPVVRKQGTSMGVFYRITSGRLESKQRFSPVNSPGKKLRVEFVAQVSTAMGAWPALWMLGKPGIYGHWPQEGEIDVMEWVWQQQDQFLSSLHWKGSEDWSTVFQQLSMGKLSSQFTTFGVEYSAQSGQEYVQFYIKTAGGQVHLGERARPEVWASTFNPNPPCTGPRGKYCTSLAPFDNDMNLIVNLAVGGTWGGLGVTNYDSFENDGVKFSIKSVKVYQNY